MIVLETMCSCFTAVIIKVSLIAIISVITQDSVVMSTIDYIAMSTLSAVTATSESQQYHHAGISSSNLTYLTVWTKQGEVVTFMPENLDNLLTANNDFNIFCLDSNGKTDHSCGVPSCDNRWITVLLPYTCTVVDYCYYNSQLKFIISIPITAMLYKYCKLNINILKSKSLNNISEWYCYVTEQNEKIAQLYDYGTKSCGIKEIKTCGKNWYNNKTNQCDNSTKSCDNKTKSCDKTTKSCDITTTKSCDNTTKSCNKLCDNRTEFCDNRSKSFHPRCKSHMSNNKIINEKTGKFDNNLHQQQLSGGINMNTIALPTPDTGYYHRYTSVTGNVIAERNHVSNQKSSPMDCNNGVDLNFTIVTALFNLQREDWPSFRRPFEQYLNYSRQLLHMNVPLLAFVDSSVESFVRHHRKHLPHLTKIITTSIQEMEYYEDYQTIKFIMDSDEFQNDHAFLDHPEGFSPEYNILMNSKFQMLHRAATTNYFNSTHFYWLDMGYGHSSNIYPNTCNWAPRNLMYNETVGDKITYIQLNPLRWLSDIYDIYKKPVAPFLNGGFFGGSKSAVMRYYQVHRDMYKLMLLHKIVDDDQTVAIVCYFKEAELFNLVDGWWYDVFKLFH